MAETSSVGIVLILIMLGGVLFVLGATSAPVVGGLAYAGAVAFMPQPQPPAEIMQAPARQK